MYSDVKVPIPKWYEKNHSNYNNIISILGSQEKINQVINKMQQYGPFSIYDLDPNLAKKIFIRLAEGLRCVVGGKYDFEELYETYSISNELEFKMYVKDLIDSLYLQDESISESDAIIYGTIFYYNWIYNE